MEELILAGRITVNRMPAEIGQKVGPGDEVRINGEPVKIRFTEPKPRALIYHKPAGELVTRDDPEDRPIVFDKLPAIRDGKWIAVGRLDYNTEGLMLFTNSGELANRMMHPRYEVEREYAVRVMGRLTDDQKRALTTGIELEDGTAKCESVIDGGGEDEGSNHWYHVVIKEGRNREVRRLFESLGLMVSRLIRTRYGRITMPSVVKRGDFYELEPQELDALLQFAGLKGGAAEAPGARPPKPGRPGRNGPPQAPTPRPGGKPQHRGRGPHRGPSQAPAPWNGEGEPPQGAATGQGARTGGPGHRPHGKAHGPRPQGQGPHQPPRGAQGAGHPGQGPQGPGRKPAHGKRRGAPVKGQGGPGQPRREGNWQPQGGQGPRGEGYPTVHLTGRRLGGGHPPKGGPHPKGGGGPRPPRGEVNGNVPSRSGRANAQPRRYGVGRGDVPPLREPSYESKPKVTRAPIVTHKRGRRTQVGPEVPGSELRTPGDAGPKDDKE